MKKNKLKEHFTIQIVVNQKQTKKCEKPGVGATVGRQRVLSSTPF